MNHFYRKQMSSLHTWRNATIVILCLGMIVLLVSCSSPPTTQHEAPTYSVTAPAIPQTPTASSTPGPIPPRTNPQLVYDGNTRTLLLFGGAGYNNDLNDTWSWDGNTWTQLHPATSPPARSEASIAYDAATKQVILFGGICRCADQPDNGLLGDTWSWDGNTWTQLHPATSPSARSSASIAYDAKTHHIILFGGAGISAFTRGFSPIPVNSETWSWDGNTWTLLHPATHPSARYASNMAYDAATQKILLFSGNSGQRPVYDQIGDTWNWDGNTWTQLHPTTSPAFTFTQNGQTLYVVGGTGELGMIYDESTQQIVLTLLGSPYDPPPSGPEGPDNVQSIWTWHGSSWIQQTSKSLRQEDAYLIYDPVHRTRYQFTSIILGVPGTFIDRFWKWTGQQWQELASWQ